VHDWELESVGDGDDPALLVLLRRIAEQKLLPGYKPLVALLNTIVTFVLSQYDNTEYHRKTGAATVWLLTSLHKQGLRWEDYVSLRALLNFFGPRTGMPLLLMEELVFMSDQFYGGHSIPKSDIHSLIVWICQHSDFEGEEEKIIPLLCTLWLYGFVEEQALDVDGPTPQGYKLNRGGFWALILIRFTLNSKHRVIETMKEYIPDLNYWFTEAFYQFYGQMTKRTHYPVLRWNSKGNHFRIFLLPGTDIDDAWYA
jgi:hypothetical protein